MRSPALLLSLIFGLSLSPLLRGAETPAAPPAAPRPAARIATELCAGCHGANLVGAVAPNLLDTIWVHGSDDASILKSIREGFYAMGDDVVVYQSHGPKTTIGEERRENPFVQG